MKKRSIYTRNVGLLVPLGFRGSGSGSEGHLHVHRVPGVLVQRLCVWTQMNVTVQIPMVFVVIGMVLVGLGPIQSVEVLVPMTPRVPVEPVQSRPVLALTQVQPTATERYEAVKQRSRSRRVRTRRLW